MTPFIHTFWSHPQAEQAVRTKPGREWLFPAGAFSSPILTLPDWYGPWPEINQAYWRSECASVYSEPDPVLIGVQLVAMTYDLSNPVVLCELENLCQPTKIYSQPYKRNVTDALLPVFAASTPARDNSIQLGVRIKSEAGKEGLVYSSRLMIAWKQ